MLYLVGLGVWDYKDISLRGLEILKSSDYIFCEFYTTQKKYRLGKLEEITRKKIKILSREKTENEVFLDLAKKHIVSLLVPGDPLVATTHSQIIIDAKEKGIKTKVIHSSSVVSAIAETGLSIYKFGKIASIPHWRPNFKPKSFMDVLEQNKKIGAHTLFLLDVDPPMNINEGLRILLKCGLNKDEKCVCIEQLGGKTDIYFGSVKDLLKKEFRKFPQCFIIPGVLNFKEEEFLIVNYKI